MIHVNLSEHPSLERAIKEPKSDHELHRLGTTLDNYATIIILNGKKVEATRLVGTSYTASCNFAEDAAAQGFNTLAKSWEALVCGTHQTNFISATEVILKQEALLAGFGTKTQRTIVVNTDADNRNKLHVEVHVKLFQTGELGNVSDDMRSSIHLGLFRSTFEIIPQGTVHYERTSISLTCAGCKVFPDNRALLCKIKEYLVKIACTLLRRDAPLSSFKLFSRSREFMQPETDSTHHLICGQ